MGEAARKIESPVWTLRAFLDTDFTDQHGDLRVELIDGQVVVAQAAPSRAHARLTAELGRLIGNAIERRQLRCFTESGSDVQVEGRAVGLLRDSAFIPDLQIRCGRTGEDGEPAVVIEILSPGNRAKHIQLKLRAYMLLPSLRDILFVHQDEPLVLHHRRDDDGRWVGPDALSGPDAVLRIEQLGFEVRLQDLYRNVLPPPEPAEGQPEPAEGEP